MLPLNLFNRHRLCLDINLILIIFCFCLLNKDYVNNNYISVFVCATHNIYVNKKVHKGLPSSLTTLYIFHNSQNFGYLWTCKLMNLNRRCWVQFQMNNVFSTKYITGQALNFSSNPFAFFLLDLWQVYIYDKPDSFISSLCCVLYVVCSDPHALKTIIINKKPFILPKLIINETLKRINSEN